jgi:hypothetical protein
MVCIGDKIDFSDDNTTSEGRAKSVFMPFLQPDGLPVKHGWLPTRKIGTSLVKLSCST